MAPPGHNEFQIKINKQYETKLILREVCTKSCQHFNCLMTKFTAGLFRISLVIELGCPQDLGNLP